MPETSPQSDPSDGLPARAGPDPAPRANRPLLGLVILLVVILVTGTIFVIRGAMGPSKSDGATTAREAEAKSADAIQKGLDAAGKYTAQRQYGKAETILAHLVEDHPFDRPLRLALARSLVGMQKYREAYEQYEKAIALEKADAALNFEAGTVASQAGLVDRAEEHYAAAQHDKPSEPKYALYMAMVQIKKGERAPALASLVRAVKLDPDLAEAWGTMAELELGDNDVGLAAQHLDKARHLQPDLDKWKVLQAKVLNRQDKPEEALTVLLSTSQVTRRSKPVLGLMGQCYGLLKRPSDAAKMYVDAMSAKPDDGDLAYEAAQWFRRAGDAEQMRKYAQVAQMLGRADAADLLDTK